MLWLWQRRGIRKTVLMDADGHNRIWYCVISFTRFFDRSSTFTLREFSSAGRIITSHE